MQNVNSSVEKVISWQQCKESQVYIYIYDQSFQNDWYSTYTGMENFAP
jgi:hypothetical protein